MKFAVVGAGVIGRMRAASVAARPDSQVVSVVDVDAEAARRLAASCGAKPRGTVAEALGEDRPDVVIVSSPVQLHEEACVAAFEAGCHVLCEKPLSNSLESCRRILAAATKSGRTFAVGFNHRYYPSVKFLKACIDGGRIGRLDHVRVFAGHDGLSNFRADWMYKGAISGGGSMMDAGIHTTDLARFVAGEVEQVYGVATNRVWQVEKSEDNALAILKTTSGVPVFYQATWTEWRGYHFFVDAYGDLGMVRAYYAPMYNLLLTQERPGGPRRKERRFYPEIMLREKLRGWETTTRLSFDEELADFVRSLSGERTPNADGWSGVRAVEIADGVYRSTTTGEAVRLADAPG